MSESSPRVGIDIRRDGVVLVLFVAFFLLLFAQLPLAGRLPGNVDTWYAVAFTNLYLNDLRELVGLGSYGSFFFPVADPHSYGETSIGLAMLPVLLRGMGLSDVTAYYVFISLVYATTAFAAYLFATLYVERRELAAMAGLAFGASNFLLSTIDSPHTTFFALAFVSLYYFKRFLLSGIKRDLWIAALVAAAQTYCSAYVFLLTAIGLVVLGLVNLSSIRQRTGGIRACLQTALVGTLLAAPFYFFYVTNLTDYFSWRSQAVLFAEFNSLDLFDFLNPMRDNLVYPEGPRFDHEDARALNERLGKSDARFATQEFALMVGSAPKSSEESLWVGSRKRAFFGLIPLILAYIGALQRRPGRAELLVLAAVAFVIALGPLTNFRGTLLPMPMYPLYEWVPGVHMFRIPSRAFALTHLAIVLLAARGLERLLARYAGGWRSAPLLAACLVSAAVVIENVPFPLRSFEAAKFAEPPADYLRFFEGREASVVLNLPSGIGYGLAGSADDLNVFNRELIYTNWLSYHGQHIVNGVNGYIPHSRIATQVMISELPSQEAIDALRELGVDFIVYNKGLVLPGEEGQLNGLRKSPHLDKLIESDTIAVFGMSKG